MSVLRYGKTAEMYKLQNYIKYNFITWAEKSRGPTKKPRIIRG